MGIDALLKEKREDILRITTRYGAHDVRIFGSVARGDAQPDSDVDFLVRLESGVTLLTHAAMVRELEELLGRQVDVVSERGLRKRIRDRILQEAVAV